MFALPEELMGSLPLSHKYMWYSVMLTKLVKQNVGSFTFHSTKGPCSHLSQMAYKHQSEHKTADIGSTSRNYLN